MAVVRPHVQLIKQGKGKSEYDKAKESASREALKKEKKGAKKGAGKVRRTQRARRGR